MKVYIQFRSDTGGGMAKINTTQKMQRCLELTYQKSKQCLFATLLLSLSCFAEAATDDYQYESFEDFQSTINENRIRHMARFTIN